MIIGISGKIGSGKDLVGQIIQYLTSNTNKKYTFEEYQKIYDKLSDFGIDYLPDWEIRKFADKLKEITCLLIGCTRDQLEDRNFKNLELGEEWDRYGYANGFIHKGKIGEVVMNYQSCDKERYLLEKQINWQTAYHSKLTPRLLLQILGTNCGRDIIHPNIWVNALMSEYKYIDRRTMQDPDDSNIGYPNWIITDVRFPNEYKAVKEKKGFLIRLIRPCPSCRGKDYHKLDCNYNVSEHESETALDTFKFKHVIINDGTIEDLFRKVKKILLIENLI